MKKSLIRSLAAAAVMMTAASGFAQVAEPDFKGIGAIVGYEITKDIGVSHSEGANATCDMAIESGRVCTKPDKKTYFPKNSYKFELIDCSEYIVLGKKHIEYYEPAQDDVPPHYASRETFDQSARRVYVYTAAPHSWKEGETLNLVPRINNDSPSKITIKPIVIKDKNAVYLTQKGSSIKRATMYGKTVYELTYYQEDGTTYSCYSYDGKQLVANGIDQQDGGLWTLTETIKVDNDGYCHASRDEQNANFEPCTALGPVIGSYPSIGLVGWLSATRMVIDDCVYDVTKHP